eukprot:Hpha_TRINITY_DN24137_c0_g1::TRINITY_DN24137_c0_g1_i1::g.9850::m.9850
MAMCAVQALLLGLVLMGSVRASMVNRSMMRNEMMQLTCSPTIFAPDFASHPRVGVTTQPTDIEKGFKDLYIKERQIGPKPVMPARWRQCRGKGLAILWGTQVKMAERLPEYYHRLTPLLVMEWGTKTARPGYLHMPKSLWSEGRNLLVLAAREQELRQKWRWDYIILMDEDIELQG